MKALESSAALRAISTLVEDCREPRRARGAKNIAGAERTFAKRRLRLQISTGYGICEYTSRATGTWHYASSHTLLGRVSGISRLIRNVLIAV
jgi:hypothetical protein